MNFEEGIDEYLSQQIKDEIDRNILHHIGGIQSQIISTPRGNNQLYDNFRVERSTITANTRTLRARWSLEIENELTSMYYNIRVADDFEIFGMKPFERPLNPSPIIPDEEYFI